MGHTRKFDAGRHNNEFVGTVRTARRVVPVDTKPLPRPVGRRDAVDAAGRTVTASVAQLAPWRRSRRASKGGSSRSSSRSRASAPTVRGHRVLLVVRHIRGVGGELALPIWRSHADITRQMQMQTQTVSGLELRLLKKIYFFLFQLLQFLRWPSSRVQTRSWSVLCNQNTSYLTH